MANHNRRPDPQYAGTGVPERSIPIRQVLAREPDPNYPPLAVPLPAVGGGETPTAGRSEQLAGEFCKAWDGTVSALDVMTVLAIASAACRIAAILVPLFMGTPSAKEWHERRLRKASRQYFGNSRSDEFHESFASELTEYLWALPDNGVSREEVESMLSEVHAYVGTTD